MRPIAILTDFGMTDHYVGVLHAVLVRGAPGAERIDLGHDVPPGDIWSACFLLRCAWPHLPDDAVVLAVVDPGVGGSRRPLAVRIGRRWLVAPDNGLAAAATPADRVVQLDWRRMGVPEPSRTFHGRDLFAPAAARLAAGVDPLSLGTEAGSTEAVPCPLPQPTRMPSGWRATILHVDHFGNLITNLASDLATPAAMARLGPGQVASRVSTYGEMTGGEVALLTGSSGLLELAVNGGSAADRTGLRRGDTVEIFSADRG